MKPHEWAIFVIVLILLSSIADADDVTLSWTPPLRQVNCTDAGPVEGLAGYRIYELVAEIADPLAEEHTLTGVDPGTHTYAATAYNDQGEESLLSGTASKEAGPRVVTDERAYIVAKTRNGFLLLVVGTVPLGTQCDSNTEVNGYNGVDPDEVTFTGAQDVIVVAQCG